MATEHPRGAVQTWLFTALFLAAACCGLWLFVHEWSSNISPTLPHRLRLLCAGVIAVSGLAGLGVMAKGLHRHRITLDLTEEERRDALVSLRFAAPSDDELRREREMALAHTLVKTFPLSSCLLTLGLATSLWVAFRHEEPAALRVVGATGSLICGLWLIGYVAARVRAGRFQRRVQAEG